VSLGNSAEFIVRQLAPKKGEKSEPPYPRAERLTLGDVMCGVGAEEFSHRTQHSNRPCHCLASGFQVCVGLFLGCYKTSSVWDYMRNVLPSSQCCCYQKRRNIRKSLNLSIFFLNHLSRLAKFFSNSKRVFES